ncbi:MAG: phosphoribosylamine--glycine ligase [Gracilimonas sp.]|uniref:phosphoribosylamine--glycine ligase n=1 Tax=Gracilimonas TaxID=649462 RepID=UPI001B0FF7F1|nr:phosphoribosylamine--glycine ligase [Gracilimonas sp.]MBO6587143.1 phosphoribosylamine--glycine ligase [Gracilimonas sp.]MBO6614369.1 phosphoribosylamine--glycine ligase [Gracilimonas sp.]
MKYNVLLLGSGGREHALAWAMAQSPSMNKLFIAPGNPGTAEVGENVNLSISDFDQVWDFIQANDINLTVVGPEQPLVDGIANFLETKSHPVFGPKLQAAMLEGSKEFAKEFMQRHNIPTAAYKVFDQNNFDEAADYIKKQGKFPVVLKADGLAGGKGVFIPETEAEAMEVLEELKTSDSLKDAASRLVIEEFMIGEEASVFAISDGESYKVIGNAQDHKRIGEGDTGLNTGGMGAYSPAPVVSTGILDRVEREIIEPTISGMKEEGNPYAGILYCGLMITKEGPKVVEYNCRFGDPECQVILPRLKADMLEVIVACTESKLDTVNIDFDDEVKCCVVMASGGYPESYEKGKVITGLDDVKNAILFHAGTKKEGDQILTNGGRVLNVVGSGKDLQTAIDNTYAEVKKIAFDKAYYRSDIGAKGLKH